MNQAEDFIPGDDDIERALIGLSKDVNVLKHFASECPDAAAHVILQFARHIERVVAGLSDMRADPASAEEPWWTEWKKSAEAHPR